MFVSRFSMAFAKDEEQPTAQLRSLIGEDEDVRSSSEFPTTLRRRSKVLGAGAVTGLLATAAVTTHGGSRPSWLRGSVGQDIIEKFGHSEKYCFADVSATPGTVAIHQGKELGKIEFVDAEECAQQCNDMNACMSYTQCDNWKMCFFKDKVLLNTDPMEDIGADTGCRSFHVVPCPGEQLPARVAQIEESERAAQAEERRQRAAEHAAAAPSPGGGGAIAIPPPGMAGGGGVAIPPPGMPGQPPPPQLSLAPLLGEPAPGVAGGNPGTGPIGVNGGQPPIGNPVSLGQAANNFVGLHGVPNAFHGPSATAAPHIATAPGGVSPHTALTLPAPVPGAVGGRPAGGAIVTASTTPAPPITQAVPQGQQQQQGPVLGQQPLQQQQQQQQPVAPPQQGFQEPQQQPVVPPQQGFQQPQQQPVVAPQQGPPSASNVGGTLSAGAIAAAALGGATMAPPTAAAQNSGISFGVGLPPKQTGDRPGSSVYAPPMTQLPDPGDLAPVPSNVGLVP